MDENQRQMDQIANEISRLTTQGSWVEEIELEGLEGLKLLKNETGLLYNPKLQPRE